ncbi:MAG: N-acetyltransferase [Sphingobacteriales bacterium]|nr:MAG: N-acetyltransferase [Sphingobacteriales bacterium]
MFITKFSQPYQQQVIDLILSIQVGEFNVPITAEAQPDLKNIPAFYQKGNGNFWVAVEDDVVVGTIALIDIGDNMVTLRKMFVHKDWRGKEKATAQKLLDIVFDWGKERNLKHIYLGTIERLHAARRFYQRNGFVEVPKSLLPSSFAVMAVDDYFYHYRF